MIIDQKIFDSLLEEAGKTPRLRMNFDLRNSPQDKSQRMLNALLPGTPMPVHRHRKSNETFVVVQGKMEEIYYDVKEDPLTHARTATETERFLISSSGPVFGICIPAGQWHSLNIIEPTVMLECKDGAYEPLGPEDFITE